MRLLIIGDVVGKSGRQAVEAHLPRLREELAVDFTVVNGENAAHGFGINDKICQGLYDLGADVITTGNHVWDQREIIKYIDGDPKLLRPLNFPEGTPGRGTHVAETADGRRVMVLNAMGRLFMDPLDDPFRALDQALRNHGLGRGRGGDLDAVVVDFHAEATSEKQAVGYYLDGRVSAVVGTHTHVPTADARVLAGGTAYVSDLGMCGDYDSVIGMAKEGSIERFIEKLPKGRLEPAAGEATLCAVLVETDDETGLARSIESLRVGGCLKEAVPR